MPSEELERFSAGFGIQVPRQISYFQITPALGQQQHIQQGFF